jgi:hypothetical protein
MEVLDDVEAACVTYALYEENELDKKSKKKLRDYCDYTITLYRKIQARFPQ